jgi:hypothetical protein
MTLLHENGVWKRVHYLPVNALEREAGWECDGNN